jgi:DNA-binding NarL/FixJ family response regulator
MSKPKREYYFVVKAIARQAMRRHIDGESFAGAFVNDCVRKALQRAQEQPDGETRLAVIEESIRIGRRNVGGIAMKLHVSESTVVRCTSEFIYDVARELGLWG